MSIPQEGAAPSAAPPFPPAGNPAVAAVLAWLVPGLGHLYLRRFQRGLLFLLIVATSLCVGYTLRGNLYRPLKRQPLSVLATAGALGMGSPYFALRYKRYDGNVMGQGYEYGTAFLLTAGLMNWLLVLDALDIARGRKA